MSILGRVFEVRKFWPFCFGRFLMLLVRPICEKGAKRCKKLTKPMAKSAPAFRQKTVRTANPKSDSSSLFLPIFGRVKI